MITSTSTVNAQHTSVTNAWWSNEMVIKKKRTKVAREKKICATLRKLRMKNLQQKNCRKNTEPKKKLNPNRLAAVIKICILNKLTSYECCCRFEINDGFLVKKKEQTILKDCMVFGACMLHV